MPHDFCNRHQIDPANDRVSGKSMTYRVWGELKTKFRSGLPASLAESFRVPRAPIKAKDRPFGELRCTLHAYLHGSAVQWDRPAAADFGGEVGWQSPTLSTLIELSARHFTSLLGPAAGVPENLYHVSERATDPLRQSLVLFRRQVGLPPIRPRFLYPAEWVAIRETLLNRPVEHSLDGTDRAVASARATGRRRVGVINPEGDVEWTELGELQSPRERATEREQEVSVPFVCRLGAMPFGPVKVSVDQFGDFAIRTQGGASSHQLVVLLPRLLLVRIETEGPQEPPESSL